MLDVNKELFHQLNEDQISFCVWKGHKDLELALCGSKDIDLLVERKQVDQFEACLSKLKFKRMRTSAEKTYPGILDYLGFDHKTGRLVHLHVYYQLVVGRPYRNSYRLPIEKLLLHQPVVKNGIRQLSVELKFIIDIIQWVLQCTIKDVIKEKCHLSPRDKYRRRCQELKDLSHDINCEQYDSYCKEINISGLPEILKDLLEKTQKGYLGAGFIYQQKQYMKKILWPYRCDSFMAALCKECVEALWQSRLLVRVHSPKLKTLENGGLTIGLVGPDGSGKTTLAKKLSSWLSWKVETKTLYMGIPKIGIVRFLGRIVWFAKGLRRKSERQFGSRNLMTRLFLTMEQIIVSFKWLMIARYRVKVFCKSRRFSAQGKVVIMDRYPLTMLEHMKEPMDGARIASQFNSSMGMLAKVFSRQERAIYSRIIPPDWIFTLSINKQMAMQRKKENGLDQGRLEQKISAVEKIKESELAIKDINAKARFDDVFLIAKKHLWEVI